MSSFGNHESVGVSRHQQNYWTFFRSAKILLAVAVYMFPALSVPLLPLLSALSGLPSKDLNTNAQAGSLMRLSGEQVQTVMGMVTLAKIPQGLLQMTGGPQQHLGTRKNPTNLNRWEAPGPYPVLNPDLFSPT